MKWKENNCSGLTLEGKYYTSQEILQFPVQDPASFRGKLLLFLREWWNDSPFLTVHTSGSTGTPKDIRVEKLRMMHSAAGTCGFLGLQPSDRALLCMPLEYIAGKMMVVRALVSKLDLIVVAPSSHPLAGREFPALQFAAMVPIQVFHSLQNKKEKERLRSVRHLIIGGGGIDTEMEDRLRTLPNDVWSTYGMTETLSHIALRRISGEGASPYYTPFKGVSLSLSPRGTLVIEAPRLAGETIVTNDRAELRPDGSFRILGREDNVICSGGIKMQIEEIEAVLKPGIPCPFAISWIPDTRLGQCVVLLWEVPEDVPVPETMEKVLQELPSYQKPRHLLRTALLPQTGTGKPSRKNIQQLCCELVKKKSKKY